MGPSSPARPPHRVPQHFATRRPTCLPHRAHPLLLLPCPSSTPAPPQMAPWQHTSSPSRLSPTLSPLSSMPPPCRTCPSITRPRAARPSRRRRCVLSSFISFGSLTRLVNPPTLQLKRAIASASSQGIPSCQPQCASNTTQVPTSDNYLMMRS